MNVELKHTDWVEEANKQYDEAKRVERWHATYNAALTGLLSHAQTSRLQCTADCVEEATIAANMTHGRIKP